MMAGGLELFLGRLVVSLGNSALQCGFVTVVLIGMIKATSVIELDVSRLMICLSRVYNCMAILC